MQKYIFSLITFFGSSFAHPQDPAFKSQDGIVFVDSDMDHIYCITRYNYPGLCVDYSECTPMARHIRLLQDLQQRKQFLEKHKCSSKEATGRICCKIEGSAPLDDEPRTASPPPVNTPPTTMSSLDSKIDTNSPNYCVTPDNYEGECVALKDCPSMVALAQSIDTNPSRKDIRYLEQHRCKRESANINVCCRILGRLPLPKNGTSSLPSVTSLNESKQPATPACTNSFITVLDETNPARKNLLLDQSNGFKVCASPDKFLGLCKPLNECKRVQELARATFNNPMAEQVNFFKAHTCGSLGTDLVCCRLSENIQIMDTETRRMPTDIGDPNSLTEIPRIPKITHENLKLLPNNCGTVMNTHKILSGNKTGIFDFPWMVLLNYADKNAIKEPKFHCGGTLIAPKYVLTAAHCILRNDGLKVYYVRAGDHNINKTRDCDEDSPEICAPPYQDIRIKTIIPHENFVGTTTENENDIGLLELSKPAHITENVIPICLPTNERLLNRKFKPNEKFTVTGWGITELGLGMGNSELLQANVKYVPLKQCLMMFEKFRPSHLHICTRSMIKEGVCKGDSGGPLQILESFQEEGDVKYVQHGITAVVNGVCGSGDPEAYTNVAYFMNWILQNIKP